MPLSEKSRLDVKAWKGHRKRFQRESLGRRALTLFLLCGGSACLLGTGIPTTSGLVLLGGDTPSRVSQRTLTFADRVAYQRAIEEGLLASSDMAGRRIQGQNHRFEAMVSRRHRWKRKSKITCANRHWWLNKRRWPVTAREMQAEMDRMASHTLASRGIAGIVSKRWPTILLSSRSVLPDRSLAERLNADLAVVAGAWPLRRGFSAADTAASTANRLGAQTNVGNAVY